jgi:hypothetical protein
MVLGAWNLEFVWCLVLGIYSSGCWKLETGWGKEWNPGTMKPKNSYF